jgi:hypothetical protein
MSRDIVSARARDIAESAPAVRPRQCAPGSAPPAVAPLIGHLTNENFLVSLDKLSTVRKKR